MEDFLKEYNKEVVYSVQYEGTVKNDIIDTNVIKIIDSKNLKIFLEKEEEISNVLKTLLLNDVKIEKLYKEEITLKRILEMRE